MNHKLKRPKNRRAGCLMCKPWKVNGAANGKHMCKANLLDHGLFRLYREGKE